MATHPNATPPTKAPSQPLPVTTLPNGAMTVTATTTVAAPPSPQTESSNFLSSIGSGTILYTLIGIGVVVLAGLGWFLSSRKNESTPQP